MTLTTCTNTDPSELAVVTGTSSNQQKQRILAAIGVDGDQLPLVDEETLSRYFEYLSKNLSLPFTAHYPKPKNQSEQDEFRCTVLELLDPSKFIGDQFDGIFCKTRKAGFEVNLPLIELELPESNPEFQMIEDYWYWFWNWR